jgi:RimJ/RimL family protein N-acetyltransferase
MRISEFEKDTVKTILFEKGKSFMKCKYFSPLNDGVYITPVTLDSYSDELLQNLSRWRSNNQHGFVKIFNITIEGTKTWLDLAVQQRKDRLLFLVFDCNGKVIGHLGVSSFDFQNKACEIDNVVRGEISQQNGVMFSASKTLIKWIDQFVKPNKIYIRVLNDNTAALSLYHRLGFVPFQLEGLEKVEYDEVIEWLPVTNGVIDRLFFKMKLKGKQYK